MNVTIICVGKLKEKYLKDAISEYAKRLSRFAKFEVVELPDKKIPENASEKTELQILADEGDMILSKIKETSYVVAMCIEGKLVSSEDLAQITQKAATIKGNITYVIGGSLGLDERVKKRADERISFGRITLPHQLMRVVLSEQIYRAFKINANEKYHK